MEGDSELGATGFPRMQKRGRGRSRGGGRLGLVRMTSEGGPG